MPGAAKAAGFAQKEEMACVFLCLLDTNWRNNGRYEGGRGLNIKKSSGEGGEKWRSLSVGAVDDQHLQTNNIYVCYIIGVFGKFWQADDDFGFIPYMFSTNRRTLHFCLRLLAKPHECPELKLISSIDDEINSRIKSQIQMGT